MILDMEAAAIDHEALLDTYIRAINVCTKDRPDDLTVSVHMCRGNFKVLFLNVSTIFVVPDPV
jgi:methionine synthase II (cobalamin-independent)